MNEDTQNDLRRNTAMAAIIEAGIATSEREGRHLAAAHMLAHGAPFRVIVRVLSEHIYRRGAELKT